MKQGWLDDVQGCTNASVCVCVWGGGGGGEDGRRAEAPRRRRLHMKAPAVISHA